ncbi:MAG: ABC transporter permease [Planctomycetota bacterium]|nr:ABC transporter permease [Planctomycetota bacterium]
MSNRARAVMGEGLRHVARHPLRSILTAFTSAIAIAVTVNVISLSFGMQADIAGDVDLFGRRTIDVGVPPALAPGAPVPALGDAEVARMSELLVGLEPIVVPRRQRASPVRAAADTEAVPQRMQLVAAPPAYVETLSIPLAYGRWLVEADDALPAPNACVLDHAAAARLFADPAAAVGAEVELGLDGALRRMRVVGVLADPMRYRELFEIFDEGEGARTLTSSLLSFRNVYVPARTFGGGAYTGVSIVLPDDEAVLEAQARLIRVWADASDLRALSGSSLIVFVRRQWMEALGASTMQGSMLGNIVWLLIVLVAAVMISTLNLITVRERYDEVALRRCEGARRVDIAMQITFEGMTTAVIGGLAGLPIGYFGASVMRSIVGFPFRFELRYAIAATGVAVLLGLLSSVVPARHAAALQPARVLGRRLR